MSRTFMIKMVSFMSEFEIILHFVVKQERVQLLINANEPKDGHVLILEVYAPS